jgi:hypothetical protein
MNTQQSTLTHFLEPEYSAVIAEHLTIYAHSIAYVVEPDLMGRYDAEQGLPCDAHARGYRKPSDVDSYIGAYHATATLWAQTVAGINSDSFDYDGALQELIDGREDEDFWRIGAW